MPTPNIAIIGAGLAGLTLAHKLQDKAHCTLFEKARGVSGRMATRSTECFQFDFGAQFFTVKDPLFESFLAPFIAQDIVQAWPARFVELDGNQIMRLNDWQHSFAHYLGNPRMTSLCKALAVNLNVYLQTHIKSIEPVGKQWLVNGEIYDWVITTCPVEQARELLPACFAHHQALDTINMQSCYTLMIGFKTLSLNWDAALVHNADISWISVNSSKPNRPANCMVAHATNDWADHHIEMDLEYVKHHLLTELEHLTGLDTNAAYHIDLHRWRYANISKQHGPKSYLDIDNQLAACGDWCIQGRVESAFLSANYTAEQIISKL